MGIELSLEEARKLFESIGLHLTDQQIAILLLVFMFLSIGAVQMLTRLLRLAWKTGQAMLARTRRDHETEAFLRIRNRFAKHRIIEIDRLNQESDWNDFYYTKLEAEVEVGESIDFDSQGGGFVAAWLRAIPALLRSLLGIPSTGKIADNLIEAIESSHSRAFLLIGDPGAGKTVSLRHLALRLAEECAESKDAAAVVPLYLNLKSLNISTDEVTGDSIRKWVLDQLRAGQDRLIHQFLDRYFEPMLDKGQFFSSLILSMKSRPSWTPRKTRR